MLKYLFERLQQAIIIATLEDILKLDFSFNVILHEHDDFVYNWHF